MFDFNKIIKKYNYTKQFGCFLKQIYIELVKYYGNENIIYNAFLNTEIISVPSIYDYLKENDMLEEGTLVGENDIKRSSGIYTSKPLITRNEQDFELSGIKRIVLIKDFDINNTSKKATLIHILCHMIKSYENEYIIKGNILVNNSGIIERYYKLTEIDGKACKRLITEKGVGLEEGLTALAEEYIARRIVDEDYLQSGYGAVYVLAKTLTYYINESLIKYASLQHDKDVLDEKIENYKDLEELADIAYKLNLEMYAKAFEPEKIDRIANMIIKIIEDYKTILSKEKGKSK